MALITRRRLINFELHYELFTNRKEKRMSCQCRGICNCKRGKEPELGDRVHRDDEYGTIVNMHEDGGVWVCWDKTPRDELMADYFGPGEQQGLYFFVEAKASIPEDGGRVWGAGPVTVEFTGEYPAAQLDLLTLGRFERHPSSQAFHDRIDSYKDLHDRKQLDYGTSDDPFANIRAGAKKLGLPAWIGAVLRMNDKIERLNKAAKQYIETGEITLANEGVLDSFDDLAVYSGIGAVVFSEEA